MSQPFRHVASPRSAASAAWMLGPVCALAALWLGDVATGSLVPGAVIAAGLAALGSRRIGWIVWLPLVAVVASVLDPLPAPGRFGPVIYLHVMLAGLVVLAAVRGLALGRPLVPRTSLDRGLAAIVALSALALVPAAGRAEALRSFERITATAVLFYAAVAATRRPGGAARVWPAFPLAAAMLGAHAAVVAIVAPGALAAHARAANATWASSWVLLGALVISLPVSVALALEAPRARGRVVLGAAAGLSAAGIVLHLELRPALAHAVRWARFEDPIVFSKLAVLGILFSAASREAWRMRRLRSRERARWTGLSLSLALATAMLWIDGSLRGPTVEMLVAAGGGLVLGSARAEAAERRATEHEPVRERMAA